jgi:Holliday junction resolvase RusA-like endonuclease
LTEAIQTSLPIIGPVALVPGPIFLAFELQGKPGHKARHRSRIVFPKAGRPFIHNYPDPDTEAYEKMLAQYAALMMRRRPPTTRPITLLVHSFRSIPVSWTPREKEAALIGAILPTSRPDWDNYGKITDALNGVVWHDDAQVTDGRVIKVYSDQPALRIEVREMIEPGGNRGNPSPPVD